MHILDYARSCFKEEHPVTVTSVPPGGGTQVNYGTFFNLLYQPYFMILKNTSLAYIVNGNDPLTIYLTCSGVQIT